MINTLTNGRQEYIPHMYTHRPAYAHANLCGFRFCGNVQLTEESIPTLRVKQTDVNQFIRIKGEHIDRQKDTCLDC